MNSFSGTCLFSTICRIVRCAFIISYHHVDKDFHKVVVWTVPFVGLMVSEAGMHAYIHTSIHPSVYWHRGQRYTNRTHPGLPMSDKWYGRGEGRHTHTERQTDRQTDRETERQRRGRQRQREGETERGRDRETERKTERERQRERQREKHWFKLHGPEHGGGSSLCNLPTAFLPVNPPPPSLMAKENIPTPGSHNGSIQANDGLQTTLCQVRDRGRGQLPTCRLKVSQFDGHTSQTSDLNQCFVWVFFFG